MSDLVERLRELDKAGRAELGKHAWSINDPELYADLCQGLREAASEVERLTRERDEALELADRLKLEAQIHSGEARAANSTVHEIYQLLSGAKGEPGTWHGADPARRFVARTREVLAPFAELADQATFLAESDSPDAVIAHHLRAANTLFNELKESKE